MAKHGKHRRGGGRTTPKGTRPIGYGRTVGHDEPEIVRSARTAIRGGPVELLRFASSIVETCTERPADRWGPTARSVPDLATHLADFARSGVGPAQVVAAAMLPMIRDDLLVARTSRLLEDVRAEPGPD